MRISAYVPCHNRAATVRDSVASLLAQTPPPDEVLVIDDGSTDGSARQLAGLPVRLVAHPANLGRGATRARAMSELAGDLVLSLDASFVLPPGFLDRAVAWFDQPAVAAVFGRIAQPPPRSAVERWRGRHLFHLDAPAPVNRRAALQTFATLVRRASVLQVGNYRPQLRHSEDADLGRRLLAAGADVVFDPSLAAETRGADTWRSVLERYWRWHAGVGERASWLAYARNVNYWVKLAARDARGGDPAVAGLSLFCPHYCFWKSWWRRRRGLAGAES